MTDFLWRGIVIALIVVMVAALLAAAWVSLLVDHARTRRPCDAQDLRQAGREGAAE